MFYVKCRKQRGFERSGIHKRRTILGIVAAFTSDRTKVDIRKHQTMEMCESLNQKIKLQLHFKNESKKKKAQKALIPLTSESGSERGLFFKMLILLRSG